MSDVKVFLKKIKPVFPTNRSLSEPAPTTTSQPEEELPQDIQEEKKPLRRSKSGRVKVFTRTRSMVSTYDFNIHEQKKEDRREEAEDAGRKETEMMKRIERVWPGMAEEEKKMKIVRFQDI